MSEVVLKEQTTKLAGILKDGMKVGTEGIVEITPDLYEKTLTDTGLTMDTVKAVHDHRDLVIAAAGLALGEVGLDHFKVNKDSKQVSVEMPVYKDQINMVFQREKEVQTAPGSGETKTAYGTLRPGYTVVGAANKGELKKVKTHLANLAAAALK